MPGPFSPSDNLIGPIVHQIALFVGAQIPSIAHIYEDIPDVSPQDNSVIIPLLKAKIVDETSGKVKINLTFALSHIFRRTKMQDNVVRAYSYVMPWLQLLSAWPNQNLNGQAISVSSRELIVRQAAASGQPVVTLAVQFDVLTEFNASLT